ncbi:MAG TPA: hypothetical protein VF476_06445 [Chitinophagaceae bacterium]
MKTTQQSSHPKPVITQTQNNTTLWIGHLQTDPTDHFAGQTFICPNDGLLDNIQVYSASVQYPGDLRMTLHEFDAAAKIWGPAIAEATLSVEKKDGAKWIQFDLPSIQLQKGKSYGFRLNAHNALIALGEAATGNTQPFTGQEWNADSKDQKGHYFSYFSLAFKVELCA